MHGSQQEKGQNSPFGLEESLSQVEELRYLGVLFIIDGRIEWEMDVHLPLQLVQGSFWSKRKTSDPAWIIVV